MIYKVISKAIQPSTHEIIKILQQASSVYFLGDTRIAEQSESAKAAQTRLNNMILKNPEQIKDIAQKVFNQISRRWWEDPVGGYGHEHLEENNLLRLTLKLFDNAEKSNDSNSIHEAVSTARKILDRQSYIASYQIARVNFTSLLDILKVEDANNVIMWLNQQGYIMRSYMIFGKWVASSKAISEMGKISQVFKELGIEELAIEKVIQLLKQNIEKNTKLIIQKGRNVAELDKVLKEKI